MNRFNWHHCQIPVKVKVVVVIGVILNLVVCTLLWFAGSGLSACSNVCTFIGWICIYFFTMITREAAITNIERLDVSNPAWTVWFIHTHNGDIRPYTLHFKITLNVISFSALPSIIYSSIQSNSALKKNKTTHHNFWNTTSCPTTVLNTFCLQGHVL